MSVLGLHAPPSNTYAYTSKHKKVRAGAGSDTFNTFYTLFE